MEALVFLLLIVIAVCFVVPLVAIAKAAGALRSVKDFETRLRSLEAELQMLKRPHGEPTTEQTFAAKEERETAEGEPFVSPAIAPPSQTRPASVPPPLPEEVITAATPVAPPEPPQPPTAKPPAPEPSLPAINWEQFMGAKLFAWIGGLALFLGVAFFVKYSFEHNLVPPEVRVVIGFVVGLVLVGGGLALKRKENVVTAQTLCATGILILYAVTFACRSFYHFAFFGLIPTFLLMALITAVAFLLAVRLNAIAVAILGMAGGFLTPILLSTGQDRPLGLFIYIALLDIGLLAASQRQRWNALPILGGAGTALTQIGWIATFFVSEKYFDGNKVLVVMAVFAGFQALFLGAVAWAKRAEKMNRELTGSALGLAAVAMLSAFYLLSFQTLGQRPALLFSYIFLVDLGLLALTLLDAKFAVVAALAGLAAFTFLGAWTGNYLTSEHLYTALAFYFVFALFHSATPLALQRPRKITP